MSFHRVSQSDPADPSSTPADASDLPVDLPPVNAGGFLLDTLDTADTVQGSVPPDPEPDGEQLFRQATHATSMPSPARAAVGATDPGYQPPDPASTALVLRIFGGLLIVFAIVVAKDADAARNLIAPALLLGAGLSLVFYFASVERLRRDHVIDRWDMLMDGATGRGDMILAGTVARIEQQGLPQIQHATRDLAASLLRGSRRPFLIVTHTGNRRLAPYQMHVNVRDYGTSLQTSWYLSYHRGFFEKLAPNPLVALDLFDEQDLRAYVGVVHHCFMDAVTELMLTLGQDASKLERNSRGFLGIS